MEFNLGKEFPAEVILGDSNCIFWNKYKCAKKKNYYSLPDLIDESSFKFRAKFLKLRNNYIDDLQSSFSNVSTIPFLASSLCESNPFKDKILLTIIKIIALEELIDQKDISLINCYITDKEIISSLKILCKSKDVNLRLLKSKKNNKVDSIKKKFKKVLPVFILGLIYWAVFSIKHYSLKILHEKKLFDNSPEIFFGSYFIHLSKESCEKGVYCSKQWDKLPNKLTNLGYSIIYRHIFLFSELIPDTKKGRLWIEKFNKLKINEDHLFYEQYLTLDVILKVLFYFLKIQLNHLVRIFSEFFSNSNNNQCFLQPLFKKIWLESFCGPICVQNLFFLHLFDKTLRTIPKQKIGIYLQENQGWERIFLLLWRKHGHGTIIGVPHTTIPFWFFSHFDSETKYLPQPDIVAVNGPLSWRVLEEAGYQMDRCYPVEALRYQYLNTLPVVKRSNNFHSEKRILLVLGDIQAETTNQMLVKLVDAYSKLQSNIKIWFKPHPANWIDLARVPMLPAHLKEQNLLQLFPEVDIVLASVCTSASLDAFCAGLPVINYLDPDDFNLSPLYGHPNARFACSAEEILELLQDLQWLSTPSKANPSDFFWLDEELPRWTRLIQTTFAEHIKVSE